MTETERIRRVREMERRMHELSAAAEGLQTALAAYEAALPARRALEDYYESPPLAGGLRRRRGRAAARGSLPRRPHRGRAV